MTANGTLVVPATHADGIAPVGGGFDHSHLLLSHDGGATWQLGPDGPLHSNEAAVAQLADGSLLLNARDLSERRRFLARSEDGGRSWAQAWRSDELSEPPPRGVH